MEKNTKNKETFKYGRGAAAAVILTAGAAMLSGCVAVEASKPASGAVVVSDAAQKEGTLTVVSSESVVVTPDMAEVVFGITTEDADAAACQQKNAEQLNGFVEYLKAQGISESSIMTSSFSLNPQYDWSGNTQRLIGYQMNTQVTVTDVAVEDVGSLLSNGVNEGANEIYSVSYFSSQYDTAYGDALAKAVDAAKAKGTVLAEASGKALGEVLNVEEYQDDQYGRYVSSSINMSRASGAVAEATMADMGVMPGEMDVEAVIRVEFALTDSQ